MVLWVFGYGSLVWNPGFDFDERVIGFIRDYRRVFDLACFDHRGTPQNPARTLTLEPKEGSICWGVAYCIHGGSERERAVVESLERRECEYDGKTIVDFYKDKDSIEPTLTGVLVFTSTLDKLLNKYYLGPAPLEEMASQIATASGPCGNNRDYLFRLENALFEIGHGDDMVIELANEVRNILVKKVRKGKKKQAVRPTTHLPFLSFISGVQVHPLADAAVGTDSYEENVKIGMVKGESHGNSRAKKTSNLVD